MWRYDGNAWTNVGGPGAQFVGICNALYALNPDRSRLLRLDRYTKVWNPIGGPANAIIGGGSKVYASTPSKAEIWEYSRYLANWKKIGRSGWMWVGVAGTVYGLAPDKRGVQVQRDARELDEGGRTGRDADWGRVRPLRHRAWQRQPLAIHRNG